SRSKRCRFTQRGYLCLSYNTKEYEMSPSRLECSGVTLLLIFSLPGIGQELPRADSGAPLVAVWRASGKWIIAGKKNKVSLSESDLAIKVQTSAANWEMVPSSTRDMLVRSGGEEFYLRLADAKRIDITQYDTGFKTGVKIVLSKWQHNGK